MLRWRPAYFPTLSVLVFLVIWQAAAEVADSTLLPGPLAVFAVMTEAALSGELLPHLAITLLRVAVSFVVAMLIGTAIGIVMGRSPAINRLFDPWLIVLLNLSALVIIILAYIWVGLTEAAVILAVAINKIPNVVVTMREGARSLDRDYLEMAESFRLGSRKTLVHVVMPQLYPFLTAAARSGLALIWKIVLVAELLGRSNGIGFQLNLYFQLFDISGILAYAFAFILVVQGIEVGVLRPLERRAHRWRR
ncbi:MAG: ABC transporter permease [Rhodospirillales bacterium]|nr:ABC transporter permease [Rhodospirillales bacterium]